MLRCTGCNTELTIDMAGRTLPATIPTVCGGCGLAHVVVLGYEARGDAPLQNAVQVAVALTPDARTLNEARNDNGRPSIEGGDAPRVAIPPCPRCQQGLTATSPWPYTDLYRVACAACGFWGALAASEIPLNPAVEAAAAATPFADADLAGLRVEEFARSEVAAAFGIPPELMSVATAAAPPTPPPDPAPDGQPAVAVDAAGGVDPNRWMDLEEFRDFGFLQEVNRQFFHPLGLALVLEVDSEGWARLAGIQDYRDDPEGIVFADTPDWEKWNRVEHLRRSKLDHRAKVIGLENLGQVATVGPVVVQPLGPRA